MKANCITNACDVANKAFIIIAIFNVGSVAFMGYCIHGFIPKLSINCLASRTW
jgi:hypothetical protein